MAADVELPQVARHHLRHRPDAVPVYRGSDRQQIPDPALCRRASWCPACRRSTRSPAARSNAPIRRPISTSARTRRWASAPGCPSGSTAATSSRGGMFGGGDEIVNAALQQAQRPWDSRPATPARRWAAGSARRSRLGRRPQGPQIPHRRHGRPGAGAARRGAAADRAGRHLSCARAGHASMRPSSSAPTTTRSSASPRSPSTTTIPGWWEGSAMLHLLRQPGEVERRCPSTTRPSWRRPAMPPTPGCSPSTIRSTPSL